MKTFHSVIYKLVVQHAWVYTRPGFYDNIMDGFFQS